MLRSLKTRLPVGLGGSPKPKRPTRRHQRHACVIVATMTLTEKNVPIDGLVTELSLGGVRFRPATTFILDRTGEDVTVEMDGLVVAGVIRATLTGGYGIQLDEDMTEKDFEEFSKYFRSLEEFAAARAA